MRRADLLKAAGITGPMFNNLAARDLLPFSPKVRAAKWGDYSADDVFRLALMVKLGSTCWSQRAATNVVRGNFGKLKDAAKAQPSNDRAWFLGSVWLTDYQSELDAKKRISIIARAGDVEAAVGNAVRLANARLSYWAVVDATQLLSEVYARAVEQEVVSAQLDALVDLLGARR